MKPKAPHSAPAFGPLVQNATWVRRTTASNLPPTGVAGGVPAMPPPAAVEKRLLILPCRKSNKKRILAFGYQFSPAA